MHATKKKKLQFESLVFQFLYGNFISFLLCKDCIYCVMQSYVYNFCGDVVMGSFNMEYRGEDSILFW